MSTTKRVVSQLTLGAVVLFGLLSGACTSIDDGVAADPASTAAPDASTTAPDASTPAPDASTTAPLSAPTVPLTAPTVPPTGPPPDGSTSVESTTVRETPPSPRLTIGTLIDSARSQVGVTTGYDPAYVQLRFPGGDVDPSTGVCTDVLIRAYRGIGVDLQELVHIDMRANFSAYPSRWGLRSVDSNIDHRRVPNLEKFFARNGGGLPISERGLDYRPGDVVTWMIGDRPHTGLVTDELADDNTRYLIVHNVGSGAQLEDVLFEWPITGHFRWIPGT